MKYEITFTYKVEVEADTEGEAISVGYEIAQDNVGCFDVVAKEIKATA